MVGKAKSISHTSNAIDYARNKGEELCRSNTIMGNSGEEMAREFKIYQNLNENCKKNTITVVLSPEPKDGKYLTQEDFKQITQDYLRKMNLDKHQYIAYTHSDRNHKHIHLFVNRINNQGEAYKDSFIGKKSQQTADQIAQEKGLIRAKEIELSKSNNYKELRSRIFSVHNEILKDNPKNFQEYIIKMENKGIEISPSIKNDGNIQGFRIKYQDRNFKASEIHRNMSYNKLKLNFENRNTLGVNNEKLEVLRNHRLVIKHNPKTFTEYQNNMKNKGYHVSNLMEQGTKQSKHFIIVANKQVLQGSAQLTQEQYTELKKEAEILENINIQIHLEHVENLHQEKILLETEMETLSKEMGNIENSENKDRNQREIDY